MNIAILGYGDQGRSAYEYWNKTENQLTICDSNAALIAPAPAVTKLGPDYLNDLGQFDLLVRTPGLHPRDILHANPDTPNILKRVTTVTNEFMRVCPTTHIIGVTGTKGKGTTSTLITRMLEVTGRRVHLGGNIGTPPLDLLKGDIQPEDWVVLELANFQLIDLKLSPHLAVCLMVVPEHLNWHHDIKEYLTAKQQLFVHQKSTDIAIFYAKNKNSSWIAQAGQAQKIPYFVAPGAVVENGAISIAHQEICKTDDIQLLGAHNWQNVCAAVTTVWQITQDSTALQKAIRAFQGLSHRLEYIREVEGTRYFNDSFAAVPDAAMAALDAIDQPKIMILGGFDRGLDLHELAISCVRHESDIKKVILIGASASRVATAFDAQGFHNYEILRSKHMLEIVKHAQSIANNGDAVVLSPGFPSFDMFKNFKERGTQYKEAVNQL